MPVIATQTDPCVDVIDKLNQEFAEIQDELLNTQKQLKEEQLESARGYHMYIRHGRAGYSSGYVNHQAPQWRVMDELNKIKSRLLCAGCQFTPININIVNRKYDKDIIS